MQTIVDKGIIYVERNGKKSQSSIMHISGFVTQFAREASVREACEVLVEICLQVSNIKHLPVQMQPIGTSFLDFKKELPMHPSLREKLIDVLFEIVNESRTGIRGLFS